MLYGIKSRRLYVGVKMDTNGNLEVDLNFFLSHFISGVTDGIIP